MFEFFDKLFSSTPFMPHSACLNREPGIVLMYILSNGLIALAYYSIPIQIFHFVRKRKDLAFNWIFVLFGIFILACGTTHVMDIVTLYNPMYRLDVTIKILTAIASVLTGISLVAMVPRALAIPSRLELDKLNQELKAEVEKRRLAETELSDLNRNLEAMVQQRTAELTRTNADLLQEVARREAVERELSEKSSLYNFMSNSLPQMVWVTDGKGKTQALNQRWYDYTGEVPTQPIEQKDRLQYVHPDDREQVRETWLKALAGKRMYEIELRYLRKMDQVYRWHLVRAIPMLDSYGEIVNWVASATDIDEQRNLALALQKSITQFRFLANSIPQIVWTADENGVTDYFNQQWEDYTGFTSEETCRDNHWLTVIHPDDQEKTVKRWEESYLNKGIYEIEYRLRSKEGEYRWFLGRGVAMRNEQQAVVKWFGTCTDIEDSKRMEESLRQAQTLLEDKVAERTAELQEAVQALMRSNQELEQFAYVASHDLKEPLRMVAIYNEILARHYSSTMDNETREYVNYTMEGVGRMQVLINDLLDYTRIGRNVTALTTVSSEKVVKTVLRSLTERMRETGAEIVFDALPDVMGIESQLIQLFQNLLENAIKFRKPDTAPLIHIEAKLVNSYYEFRVRDNGIGIDPQYAERVFIIFQRLHNRQEYPGTGIGLAICKKIVEVHGGNIRMESAPGEGSTFVFTLKKAF